MRVTGSTLTGLTFDPIGHLWFVPGPQHQQDHQRCYYCWTLPPLSPPSPCLIQHFLHSCLPFSPHYLSFLAWSRSDQEGPKRLILAPRPGELSLPLFYHVFIIHWMEPVAIDTRENTGTSDHCVWGIWRPSLFQSTHIIIIISNLIIDSELIWQQPAIWQCPYHLITIRKDGYQNWYHFTLFKNGKKASKLNEAWTNRIAEADREGLSHDRARAGWDMFTITK